MRHQAVPKPCGTNYYHQFGGRPQAYLTKQRYGICPMYNHYTVDGNGRDGYINTDNGGFSYPYSPDLAPQWGTFSEKKKHELNDNSLCNIPSKHVSYTANGSGRDSYISRTNGGFYPEQTVAAYQNTYVNKLRFYNQQPINSKD